MLKFYFNLETCTGMNSSTRPLSEKLKTRSTRPDEILNPPDPIRRNCKPARPDPNFLKTYSIPNLLSVVNMVQNLIAETVVGSGRSD